MAAAAAAVVEPALDFSECLKDSPRFRQALSSHEASLDELEVRVDKVIKACHAMTAGGRQHVILQSQFLATLWEMSAHFSSSSSGSAGSQPLNNLIHNLQEFIKLQNVLVDDVNEAVTKTLGDLIKNGFKPAKEAKTSFVKISGELDAALQKNAVVSRSSSVDEATTALTAARSCFSYAGADYVYQLSMLQSKKRHEVLESLLSAVDRYSTFFKRGSDIVDGSRGSLTDLRSRLKRMRLETEKLDKKMEDRHAQITAESQFQSKALKEKPSRSSSLLSNIEGYLFKRGQGTFKVWTRRWFFLRNNQLCYSKRTGDIEPATVVEGDLRICLVRPLTEIDRRFCFEVISPNKSHILQADSEDLYQRWMAVLQHKISSAIHETTKETEPGAAAESSDEAGRIQWEDDDEEEKKKATKRTAKQILLIPGNELCCDCGSEDPKWASINLGITLCIECSGIHRGLGVHVSKVRSLTLDTFDLEILKVMAELGNTLVNLCYEANVNEIVARRATRESDPAEREAWIRAKYIARAFIRSEKIDGTLKEALGQEQGDQKPWVVRKLRRRPKSKGRKCSKEEEDSLLAACEPILAQSEPVNAEKLLFGCSLGKHHVSNIDFDSDQESTDGGEDDDNLDPDPEDHLSPDWLLYRAARVHNLPVMSQALALGADKDFVDPLPNGTGRSILHQSVATASCMACEYLLLNGAKINSRDREGNTALHLSAANGATGQVCLLLKHRADHHLRNKDGKTALDIAVEKADADIVTLLRMANFNEEIQEPGNEENDGVFNDVLQEVSNMVNSNSSRWLNSKKVSSDTK